MRLSLVHMVGLLVSIAAPASATPPPCTAIAGGTVHPSGGCRLRDRGHHWP